MEHAQMWNELKDFLVANRDNARKFGGKFNKPSTVLDRVLERMQEIDPTITNEEIYYNGTEFHPENHDFLPKTNFRIASKEAGAAE
ncbi:hypothetical protein [Bacillus cereus]|uniref:hypothetical protein n=1 Tax=Bacillus cereus TaxID=1396 RepID=UPI00192673AD|nr:hypothetical protein [Bacillus cereus]MBL3774956.1 hypothetical protein [Bacillus cereus]MBL3780781.1 hypothetical protein [Bacillus cereus]MBL3792061.1 hypothetical protein [Bacillus cereus]